MRPPDKKDSPKYVAGRIVLRLSKNSDWENEIAKLVEGFLADPSKANNVKDQIVEKVAQAPRASRHISRVVAEDEEEFWENLPV